MQAVGSETTQWVLEQSSYVSSRKTLFEPNVTENIGLQPPTDFVNTLPGQLQLYNSNAVHFQTQRISKGKRGGREEERFRN